MVVTRFVGVIFMWVKYSENNIEQSILLTFEENIIKKIYGKYLKNSNYKILADMEQSEHDPSILCYNKIIIADIR